MNDDIFSTLKLFANILLLSFATVVLKVALDFWPRFEQMIVIVWCLVFVSVAINIIMEIFRPTIKTVGKKLDKRRRKNEISKN